MVSVSVESYFPSWFIYLRRFGASKTFLMKLMIRLYLYAFNPDFILKPKTGLGNLVAKGRRELIIEN